MVIAIIVPMGLYFQKERHFNKVDPVDEATGMLYSEEG